MPDVDSKIWMEKAWLPGLFPLSELKKVMLSELKVNSRNLTSYILVKTTSLRAPDPMLEDEEGNTAKACIVFYDGHQLLSEALGIAEVFILKSPLCLVEDGSQVMMIHHLSDIKVLTSDNPLFPDSWKMAGEGFSATQLKDLGNQHMKHKQYYDAIAW